MLRRAHWWCSDGYVYCQDLMGNVTRAFYRNTLDEVTGVSHSGDGWLSVQGFAAALQPRAGSIVHSAFRTEIWQLAPPPAIRSLAKELRELTQAEVHNDFVLRSGA